jgi:hypothetical protein
LEKPAETQDNDVVLIVFKPLDSTFDERTYQRRNQANEENSNVESHIYEEIVILNNLSWNCVYQYFLKAYV